jgi:hypothetical protein
VGHIHVAEESVDERLTCTRRAAGSPARHRQPCPGPGRSALRC